MLTLMKILKAGMTGMLMLVLALVLVIEAHAAGNVGVGCTSNADCTGSQSGSKCDIPTGLCVPCLPASQTVDCNDTNLCTTDSCIIPAGSPRYTCNRVPKCLDQYCKPANGACVACLNHDHCLGYNGLNRCDPVSNTCVRCTQESDCDDGSPCTNDSCNMATHSCSFVQKSCSGSTPKCRPDTGACVACLPNDVNPNIGQHIGCNDSKACTSDTCPNYTCVHQVACPSGRSCLANGACAGGCTTDANCSDPANPKCRVSDGACVQCLPSANVGGQNPACPGDAKSCTDDICNMSNMCVHPCGTGKTCSGAEPNITCPGNSITLTLNQPPSPTAPNPDYEAMFGNDLALNIQATVASTGTVSAECDVVLTVSISAGSQLASNGLNTALSHTCLRGSWSTSCAPTFSMNRRNKREDGGGTLTITAATVHTAICTQDYSVAKSIKIKSHQRRIRTQAPL